MSTNSHLAIARREPMEIKAPQPVAGDWGLTDTMELGKVLAASGYFRDVRDASQAVAKILYGREVGIGPMTALMSVFVVEGRPAPSANLIAARIKASGRYDYRVREHSAELCRIEFFERSAAGRESLGVVEWSMEDARRAELGGRGPWKSYPRAMLFARAISEGARVHAPELFGGAPVYTPEELGAEVDSEGNAVLSPSVPAATERVEMATDDQVRDIEHLAMDATITDTEREKLARRISRGMTAAEAESAIAWLSAEIEARTVALMAEAEDRDLEVGDRQDGPDA